MTSMPGVPAGFAVALADRYEIVRELGQGGMAVVYLARDVRHDRAVALKVLRPELAAAVGPERFLAEIRTTAKLQHPHILPLHDSGEVSGALFYVMPYIEGESLRQRLDREGQLPVSEAVRIAIEVAGALDYAHRQGVVHRDVKPENILLHEGRALVADFGIALAAARTGQHRLTETGLSLGTPAYMSPEQALGDPVVDGRVDIHALGCVLYEMLIGEVPFTGPTAQAIVARVATERARVLTPRRHTIPPAVDAAVMTALEKLPADRFATGQDFIAALENPNYARLTPASFGADALGRRWKRWALAGWIVAVGAAVLAVSTWNQPGEPKRVSRYGLSFPASQVPVGWGFAFSPDGSRLVYPGPGERGQQLWVKQRDQYEATPLVGTGGATDPTISPDGKWVAYVQDFHLKKIPLSGGDAVTVDSAAFMGGTVWLDDGSLIYRPYLGELRRMSATGGSPTTFFRGDSLWLRVFPSPLPSARGVLFTKCPATSCWQEHQLWVLDFRSGKERRLISDVLRGWFLPTGDLVFVKDDARMYATRFDPDRLEVRGSPVPVLDRVSLAVGIAPQVAISSSGDLVMQASGTTTGLLLPVFQMMALDRSGRATPIDTSWRFHLNVFDALQGRGWALAPDGVRLAIGLYADPGNNDIWVKQLQLPRGPLSRLTTHERSDYSPRWTVDGRWVTYARHLQRLDGSELWQRRADGTGAERLLVRLPTETIRDVVIGGKYLILGVGRNGGDEDLLSFQPGVDTIPRPLLANPKVDEAAASLSPDGRWLAYVSTETGRREVYVRPFPNIDAGKWQVSTAEGKSPHWAHSGRELFYIDGARNMVATSVTFAPAIRTSDPRVLFHLDDSVDVAENRTAFDITSDDRRFIMARQVTEASTAPPTFIVVENWFAELNEKLRKRR